MPGLTTTAAVALAALLFAAIRDIGEAVVLAAAVLAGLAYIIKGVRAISRTADQLLVDIPERLDQIEQQAAEDRDEHKAAHTEMLSSIAALDEKVAERLERIERQAVEDHEHIQAVTREFDVPVRRESRRPAA